MQIVAVNGIPRSGSTLVCQLLKGSVHPEEYEVIHTHPTVGYREPVYHTFITIRHPYDVAASRYRVRLSRNPESGGLDGLRSEMADMAQHYAGLEQLKQLPHTVLRYEHFYNDYNQVFSAFEIALDIRIDSDDRYRLCHEYSLSANKMRASKLPDFNTYDNDLIHGDHIGSVVPGSWKDTLPEMYHQVMLDYCQPIAEELGYE